MIQNLERSFVIFFFSSIFWLRRRKKTGQSLSYQSMELFMEPLRPEEVADVSIIFFYRADRSTQLIRVSLERPLSFFLFFFFFFTEFRRPFTEAFVLTDLSAYVSGFFRFTELFLFRLGLDGTRGERCRSIIFLIVGRFQSNVLVFPRRPSDRPREFLHLA